MRKKILSATALAVILFAAVSVAASAESSKEAAKQKRMEEILNSLPDSVFENVKVEDLLDDEVYLKLAKDGWSSREITTIMETAVRDKKTARNRGSYGAYAKEWRPAFGRAMSDDPLYQVKDSTLTPKAIESIYAAVGENNYNTTWDIVPYNAADRKKPGYQRTPGYFKPVLLNPSSGRTHWIVVNQKNDAGDEIYAVVDGGGIFSTHDCGETWTCITDNIPERANRSESPGYSIPVDPDDWNHLFAFMANSTVYETTDGGASWTKIVGGTHKTFKRGYCFRDADGNVKLIGADMQGDRMNNKLWISENKGVTWRQIFAPENLKETIVTSGNTSKGYWFQQMAFDPDNRDIVYFPGCYSILYFDDGGASGTLKPMEFTVYGADKSVVRAQNTTHFPFEGNGPGYMEIDPNNHNRMWYAVGNSTNNYTALYFSDDRGKTWITLHEPHVKDASGQFTTEGGFGSGTVFGNEIANVWLGGFGIRYDAEHPDQVPHMLFGCSMSSSYSVDGGRNWKEYAWGTRQSSYIDEGNLSAGPGYYYISASRHNADNHCIASHKSGRVFRGGDGGFFLNDPKISGHAIRYNNNTTTSANIEDFDWVGISHNLGQMLFYNVRVNEFGDQAIIGNTQDIDVQTYRYGRWGHWRGYEGTESSFNPYTGTGYFSGGGGAGPEGMNADSWHSARNYADVVTGSWFMLRTWSGGRTPSTLYRVDDVGRSLTDLYGAINKTVTDVGLCRKDADGNDALTVFIRTSGDNAFWMSTDSCRTFKALMADNGKAAAFSNTKLAVDPEHNDFFYFGQNGGKVYKFEVASGKWTPVGNGLPTNINCSRLLFHEGSGDLYYVDNNSGIYILPHDESQWRFWTRGYNNSKFSDTDINYTTQEFVLSDFGRGVWVADLENPSDRYFHDGFKLKEYSHRDGRRTFGIDTKWTIPMYYNYKWIVNRKPVENYNYQYLTIDENEPFVVQLELSLRESPDVVTKSDVFTVEDTESVAIDRHQGNALYSSGEGRVDIGYMDWFDQDFSVDLWVKPMSDGVIMANTQKNVDRGAKGWLLYIEGGVLKFKYYPSNKVSQPTYEAPITQDHVVSSKAIAMNRWSHVAAVQERHGYIRLYINGQEVGSAKRIRDNEEHSLNNSVIMSLFGDAFEDSNLRGSVDELKVWNKALTANDVRREMFSSGLATDGMMAHYTFNGEQLSENVESFTGYRPLSRTRAVTSPERMTVPVSANYVADCDLTGNDRIVSKEGHQIPLMTLQGANLSGIHAVVYGYDGGRWEDPTDNLSEEYYEPTRYGYMLRTFGSVTPDTKATVIFHNGKEQFDKNRHYRLYMADNSDDRMYWKRLDCELVYDDGNLKITDAVLNDLTDKKLLVVTMKPAIEMNLDGLASDGRIVIYDDADPAPDFPFTARLIEGMTLKQNSYEIKSDSTVLIVPERPLTFDSNREAHGNIQVDIHQIGGLNNVISTYVRGKNDEAMIPIPIDVVNRITPSTLDNSVQIVNGGIKVGTAADFATLNGTRNLTVMGWVRIDSETMMEKGRNNDGVTPLLFFRTSPSNAGTTGIHLRVHKTDGVFDGASLGYHWNDQSWNYSATTPFVIRKEDIGKWNHVALVVTPEGAWVYFNGMEYKMTGVPNNTIPPCTVQSPLLVGLNVQEGNKYFNGAFDHVAVWDRSLSREEIHKYMHNRVLLNDKNLLAYLTMDEKDENGRIKESLKGMSTVYYGEVSNGGQTPVPFAPYRQDRNMAAADCPVKLSSTDRACVASFAGTPYNYVNAGSDEQAYLPLNHEYYTVIFDAKPATTADITLTYNNEGIQAGEGIAVATRPVGSVTPFTAYRTATSVVDGSATFTVPASMLAESSEVMFFSTPGSNHRPNIVRVSLKDPGIENGGVILLGDGENTIDINLNVVSGSDPGARIQVVETYYASFDNDPDNNGILDIDMSKPSQNVTLRIDRKKLLEFNPFGLSDVNIVTEGTTNSDFITLHVGLKPRVELSLKNGIDENTFKATSPVSNLDVEVRLVEGYLQDNVDLKVTPDNLQTAFNIASGSLLLNSAVTVSGLAKGESPEGDYNQGWNLIGNPYLTDINLTKVQNYGDITDKVTHFVYHTLDGSDNIIAFDMTDYDDEQHIRPFQSFYVQALDNETDFTVTPVSKERTLSRKTFDYYTLNELRNVQIKLYDEQGKEVDRTTVRWNDNSSSQYVINEDAPKVVSANAGNSSSLYTISDDGHDLSINELPIRSRQLIRLGVDVAAPGQMTMKVSRLSGFNNSSDNVYLVDFDGGQTNIPLTEGTEHTFTVNDEGRLDNRFMIVTTLNGEIITENDDIVADTANGPDYRVYTDRNSLTVTGMQGDAQVNVYTVSGMLLIRVQTSEPTYTTDIEPGVYLVRIRENDKDYVSKIVVK